METLYLIKLGEIQLKEGNRAEFENLLKQNIKKKLRAYKTELSKREGRFYLKIDSQYSQEAELALSTSPGINGWAKAERYEKQLAVIEEAAVKEAGLAHKNGAKSFKVEVRRSDKSFPLDSYGLASHLGAVILEQVPELKVNIKTPDAIIHAEIRDKAYIYGTAHKGLRGLPPGSSAKALLLLSGGIDSPVAGYKMISRGSELEALYFHSYPYTGEEAWNKVKTLAQILARYSGRINLHTCHFTEVQMKINKDAAKEKSTLYLRAAMVKSADILAKKLGIKALVSGESLGQVASQTAENMRFTGSFTDLALFRPLVGSDKEDIIKCAREIGTFDTSILPYEDCCVLFAPKHPVLRADYEGEKARFEKLGLLELINQAADNIETESFEY